MRVTYYMRPKTGNFGSIERLFGDITKALPQSILTKVVYSRFSPKTPWGFLYDIVEASFRQGDVNHITGDIHIVSLLLHRRKTLLTIHDLVPLHTLKGLQRLIVRNIWYRFSINRVKSVAVISQSVKDELIKQFNINSDKINVVHDCVSDEFTPTPKPFNQEKPVVLQVGTKWMKNVERVAEALENISCHLRIIGHLNDSQSATLKNFNIDYTNVVNISDKRIVKEYKRCDILLFASLYEGFGLPIVEAQAIGRPVITSNIHSMPEVGGDAACLVDPFDPISIRNGVIRIINDNFYREQLVKKGYKNVERFNSVEIAKKYLNIYSELHS
ncbi:MAG: glycosyltransferase family 1 protein [Candidatus Electryonea clarkiae]|nr:glycosyltransferase family 1 protein [Candidatus Electryonea clarkiae]